MSRKTVAFGTIVSLLHLSRIAPDAFDKQWLKLQLNRSTRLGTLHLVNFHFCSRISQRNGKHDASVLTTTIDKCTYARFVCFNCQTLHRHIVVRSLGNKNDTSIYSQRNRRSFATCWRTVRHVSSFSRTKPASSITTLFSSYHYTRVLSSSILIAIIARSPIKTRVSCARSFERASLSQSRICCTAQAFRISHFYFLPKCTSFLLGFKLILSRAIP